MTFNPYRTVRSIEEDFKSLGLDLNEQLQEMRTLRTVDQEFGFKPLEESEEVPLTESKEDLAEGLKKVKMKKMKASDRSAARRDYRKKKSKIKRKLRRLRAKPAYKRKKAKLKRLKGTKKAGARKKFIVTSQEIVGSLVESVNTIKLETAPLCEAFENISKFADFFLDLCEADELTHVGEPLKAGKPQSLETEKDLDYVGEPMKEEPLQGDDLKKAGLADDDFPHVGEDDEEALQQEFINIALENKLPQNFASIKEDALETLSRLKNQIVSPSDAMAVLKDMASYIQGALKSIQTLATNPVVHVGQDPKADGTKPVAPMDHEGHVGQAKLDQNSQEPVKPEGDLKHIGDKISQETQKPVACEKGLDYVGDDQPSKESQKPIKPMTHQGHVGDDVYKNKPKSEVPVQTK